MLTSPRHLSALVVLGLVLSGCGGGVDESTAGGVLEGMPEVEPCVEQGYACSWSAASPESFERSMELLDEASDALAEGEDPEAVHARIAGADGVVASTWDETGVQLRVEGAPVVVAFSPLASPHHNAVAALADAGTLPLLDGGADGAPTPPPTEAHARPGTVHAATYGTTREADLRPRSALVIRPWTAYDLESMRLQQVRDGVLRPDQEPDWDRFLALLSSTEDALRASEHVTVVRDDSLAAFQSFGQHDIVYVNTHSSHFRTNKDGDGVPCDPDLGHVCGPVLGGPALVSEGDTSLDDTFEAIRYRQVDRLPVGATVGKIFGLWTVAMTADFFEATYGDDPHDAVLLLNACKTGAESIPVTGLVNRINAVGTHSVFTWDSAIDGIAADGTTAELARFLVDDALPDDALWDLVKETPLAQHTYSRGRATASLVYLGGAPTRVRDAVTVLDDGEEMQPGAVIEVDKDRNRIDELVVQVDGVLGRSGAGGFAPEDPDAVLRWQLSPRHGSPLTVRSPFTGGDAEVTVVSEEDDDTDRYRDLRLAFRDLDLEFQLEREDLVCCRSFVLTVELEGSDGAVTRHRIDPVFLRAERVDVLDPEFAQPLEADDRVLLDGDVDDGEPETYPLVVRLDDFDSSTVDQLTLEVQIGEVSLSIPGGDWDEVDDGRYRVERDVELDDFPQDEQPVRVAASVELAEDRGTVDFVADPVVLTLDDEVDCDLSGDDVSVALGRVFTGPADAGGMQGLADFLGGLCVWEAERSTVQALIVAGGGDDVRARVAAGDEQAVEGFGDAAVYDLESGNALNPSGIRTPDGGMQWNNFVNLTVAIGDDAVTFTVQGNIVIEEGPQDGLLDRLRALVAALRDA